MDRFLFVVFTMASFAMSLLAQQLPMSTNFYYGDQAIANPAMTASEDAASVSVRYQEDWLGFEDAPSTAVMMAQIPIRKQSLSLGGFLMQDSQLPLRQTTAGLTYAYHLSKRRRNTRSRRRSGQLSIGLLTAWQQTQVNSGALVLSSPNDQALAAIEGSANAAILGAGLYYASRPGGTDDKSYAFIGLGANQLLVSTNNNEAIGTTFTGIERVVHSNLTLGYHHFTGQYVLRPSLYLDRVPNSPMLARIDIQMELPNTYWGGISYGINQTAAFQIGLVLGQENDNTVRIGAQGTFNLGSDIAQRGMGYTAFAAYVFNQGR